LARKTDRKSWQADYIPDEDEEDELEEEEPELLEEVLSK
jgi:hypothetical protein